MSVSLALVPVALAMRLVMGRKRFDAWVESMQVKIPSNFENATDLRRTVRRAGYDADEWGSSYKTHIRGEELFFFWEIVDGRWTAVFGKSDSQLEIQQFIRDLEKKSGRKLFDNGQEANTEEKEDVVQTFPTNFRDSELLSKTLLDYGLNPKKLGNAIICDIEGMRLFFRQEEGQTFTLEVRNPKDLKHLHQCMVEIDDAYGVNVQQMTSQRVKEKAKEKGLEFINEEVDEEDGAIVVTLGINR